MTHIVVLGAGLGGITQAYELKQELSGRARITVVSDLPYFEFTPSNPWVAVGWREASVLLTPHVYEPAQDADYAVDAPGQPAGEPARHSEA